MPHQKRSMVWAHFQELENKKAKCLHCDRILAIPSGHVCNLSRHLKSKHPAVPIGESQLQLPDNENVIYEYVVASSPRSSVSNDATEPERQAARVHPRHSVLLTERESSVRQEKTGRKTLIEKLTAEKINLTTLQKELVEKELEEKSLRVLILQDEMKHKKLIHELENKEMQDEMDHKKLMRELEKKQMLLKIQTLQEQLEKNRDKKPQPDLPRLD